MRRISVSSLLVLTSVAGAFLLAPLQAQISTASLGGLVTDPSGSTIPDAAVTLESVTQKYVRSTTTNSAGEYKLTALPPGEYKLTIAKAGFNCRTETGIGLTSGQASTLDLRLAVAGCSEQVTVTEAPPLFRPKPPPWAPLSRRVRRLICRCWVAAF